MASEAACLESIHPYLCVELGLEHQEVLAGAGTRIEPVALAAGNSRCCTAIHLALGRVCRIGIGKAG